MFEYVLNLGVEVKFEEVLEIKDLGIIKEVVIVNEMFEFKVILIIIGVVLKRLDILGEMNYIV